MGRAAASDNWLSNADASKVAAMIKRGDRKHDIAAWFGVNQARVADVEDGKYSVTEVDPSMLPPSGSPGPKLTRIIAGVRQARDMLQTDNPDLKTAIERLTTAVAIFEKNE